MGGEGGRGEKRRKWKGSCDLLLPQTPGSAPDLRLHFFSERVINLWNNLDDQTVSASSLNCFKSKLTRLRNSGIGLFMDKFVYRPQKPSQSPPPGMASSGELYAVLLVINDVQLVLYIFFQVICGSFSLIYGDLRQSWYSGRLIPAQCYFPSLRDGK